jgi:hypothetical protein
MQPQQGWIDCTPRRRVRGHLGEWFANVYLLPVGCLVKGKSAPDSRRHNYHLSHRGNAPSGIDSQYP